MVGLDDGSRQQAVRRARVSDLVSGVPAVDGIDGVADALRRVCVALVADLPLIGAAVTLMSDAGSEGVVAGSDDNSKRIDELQFTLGEGPSLDAFEFRRPVLIVSLRDTGVRWPGYSEAALAAGVAAVFAFPLHIGGAAFGVLAAYGGNSDSLDDDHLATALMFVEIATETLLDGNTTTSDGDLDRDLGAALDYRSEIYQAQGMVMVALGVTLAEALARMRAHAFASGRELADVSRDIVEGRLSLQRDVHPREP